MSAEDERRAISSWDAQEDMTRRAEKLREEKEKESAFAQVQYFSQ